MTFFFRNIIKVVKNMFISIDKYTYMSILINIIIFYSLQYLFFKLVLSKILNKIILDKLETIKILMRKNKAVDFIIRKFIEKDYDIVKENSEKEKAVRDKTNKKADLIYILSPIMIYISIVIFLAFYRRINTRNWTIYDTLNIILIFFAYLTEIYFILLIVDKYIIIGDQELIYKVLKAVL
jgi:hypothetical protein